MQGFPVLLLESHLLLVKATTEMSWKSSLSISRKFGILNVTARKKQMVA